MLFLWPNVGAQATDSPYPWEFGVGVHLGTKVEKHSYDSIQTANALAWLGDVSFRDDVVSQRFKHPLLNGRLPVALDGLQYLLDARGSVRPPLMILSGNNLEKGLDVLPATRSSRAYTLGLWRRALPALSHYRPYIEIWNEWNIRRRASDVGQNDAAHYVQLVKSAIPAIRSSSPHSKILVGASGGDAGWKWTKDVVRQGGLKGADGLSVHIYQCYENTRNVVQLVEKLEQLQAQVASIEGHMVPIYLTEFGWPTYSGRCGVSENQAAARTGQFMLRLTAFPWLKGIWLYELKDSERDPSSIQSHFGLFDYNYRPKIGACMVRETLLFLRNKTFIHYSETPDHTVEMIFRGPNGSHSRAVWSATPQPLELRAGEIARPSCIAGRDNVNSDLPTFIELTKSKS